jgi:dTMP kinase
LKKQKEAEEAKKLDGDGEDTPQASAPAGGKAAKGKKGKKGGPSGIGAKIAAQ